MFGDIVFLVIMGIVLIFVIVMVYIEIYPGSGRLSSGEINEEDQPRTTSRGY